MFGGVGVFGNNFPKVSLLPRGLKEIYVFLFYEFFSKLKARKKGKKEKGRERYIEKYGGEREGKREKERGREIDTKWKVEREGRRKSLAETNTNIEVRSRN